MEMTSTLAENIRRGEQCRGMIGCNESGLKSLA
jgi:hypothetical protein